MYPVRLARELVDRQIRPAQRGGATVADRETDSAMLRATQACFALRMGWPGGVAHTFGLYGRGRYGQDRYVEAAR